MFVEEKKQGEVTTKLKLSEAIRIGAELMPKCTNMYFSPDGKSCAIGAALHALFGATWRAKYIWQIRKVQSMVPDTIFGEILHRNDHLRYTREQIADWLEAQGY